MRHITKPMRCARNFSRYHLQEIRPFKIGKFLFGNQPVPDTGAADNDLVGLDTLQQYTHDLRRHRHRLLTAKRHPRQIRRFAGKSLQQAAGAASRYTQPMQHGQRISGLLDIGQAKRTKRSANTKQGGMPAFLQPRHLCQRRLNLIDADLRQMSKIDTCRMAQLACLKVYQFKASTTKISHIAGGGRLIEGQPTRHMMCFFCLRQYFDGGAQNRTGRAGKFIGIGSTAHRCGCHGMCFHHTHALHDAGKAG